MLVCGQRELYLGTFIFLNFATFCILEWVEERVDMKQGWVLALYTGCCLMSVGVAEIMAEWVDLCFLAQE